MFFNFLVPAIYFGRGRINELNGILSKTAGKVFLVCGSGKADPERVVKIIKDVNLEYVRFFVSHEPTIKTAEEAVTLAREAHCETVICYGGGSVMDVGKAVSSLLTNEGPVLNYVNVVGKGLKPTQQSALCIAIPTTAGTGAELTEVSVFKSLERRIKAKISSPLLVPDIVIVDPEVTMSMSREVTMASGMDAITHLIEGFVSKNSSVISEMLCREGLKQVSALQGAWENGDIISRERMCYLAMLGGLTSRYAGLCGVHGFVGPLGVILNKSHGVLCAKLLPNVMRKNIELLHKQEQGRDCLAKYKEIAIIMLNDNSVSAEDGVDFIQNLCRNINVELIGNECLSGDDIEFITEKFLLAGSTKLNPVVINKGNAKEILTHLFQIPN